MTCRPGHHDWIRDPAYDGRALCIKCEANVDVKDADGPVRDPTPDERLRFT